MIPEPRTDLAADLRVVRVKAPFAYFGGKSGMAAEVVSLLPPHRVYLEPFFGSGAVLFAKPPAVHEIINDVLWLNYDPPAADQGTLALVAPPEIGEARA